MEPIDDCSDERPKQSCIHCGTLLESSNSNEDHVPSKCLLDRPLPKHSPKATVCRACNSSFALDEEYLCAFLATVLSGSAEVDSNRFPSAAGAFEHSPRLRDRVAGARREQSTLFGEHEVLWAPEAERINRVIVKNARGHLLHEIGEATTSWPEAVGFVPVVRLSAEQRSVFEYVDLRTHLPEVGSRLMQRVVRGWDFKNGWVIVQKNVYRYAVMDGGETVTVRTLIRNYLATEVHWGPI